MGKSVTRGSADDRERESSPTPGQVVPDGPVVTGVPHRQLGRILREMRSETGLSILTAAKAVGMGSGSLQRLECGQASKIHDAKLVKLCRLYQGMDRLEELKTLAAQRREQSWWDERTDMLAPSFKVYLGLEAAAERLTVYRPDIISSLFQTQEYAEVLDRIYFHDDSPGERAQRMEVRRKRLGVDQPLPVTAGGRLGARRGSPAPDRRRRATDEPTASTSGRYAAECIGTGVAGLCGIPDGQGGRCVHAPRLRREQRESE
ncbi:helix-turn-helix domain-containing protein [Nocardia farcinica]|nr:helix-turn-helix domain-containing protein [Nocardia farcinica]MBF6384741.1 helix-turn-helix domain-containing protein [Nocardia farcinica]MBF6539069.1 helix-turn-helix domain-containing protein [Nocardia farcinica]